MRSLGLLIFVVFFSVFAQAAIPADLDIKKWGELIEQTQLNGASTSYPNGIYLTVSSVVPKDTTQPRQADYFSTIGRVNEAGEYIPDHIEAVSETWTLDAASNWHIDQWIFITFTDGDVYKMYHRVIVKEQSGIVLSVDDVPATEAEALQKWSSFLNAWFARMPLSL